MLGTAVTLTVPDSNQQFEAWWHLPTARAADSALVVVADNDIDDPAALQLAEGAAELGFTVVRTALTHPESTKSQIAAAFQFIRSFGKEMKPKRYYLAVFGVVGNATLPHYAPRHLLRAVFWLTAPANQPAPPAVYTYPNLDNTESSNSSQVEAVLKQLALLDADREDFRK